jgi:hypothetical protein
LKKTQIQRRSAAAYSERHAKPPAPALTPLTIDNEGLNELAGA